MVPDKSIGYAPLGLVFWPALCFLVLAGVSLRAQPLGFPSLGGIKWEGIPHSLAGIPGPHGETKTNAMDGEIDIPELSHMGKSRFREPRAPGKGSGYGVPIFGLGNDPPVGPHSRELKPMRNP